MPTRTKTLLLTVLAALTAVAGVSLFHRFHNEPPSNPAAAGSQPIRLPFALPCSTNSADAGLFYSALRHSDRAAVARMLAANRVFMISKGAPLSISAQHPLAIITVQGDAEAPASCFIPADVVPAIERRAYR